MNGISIARDGSLDGPTNMARDVALLEGAEAGQAGARVYSWDGPWVSLGHYQRADRDLLDPSPVPWVMRPTGGKAVLHGHDVTVGLAISLAQLGVGPRQLKEAYRRIAEPLIGALNECGLDCDLAERTPFAGRGVKTADCFAHISPNDIVHRRTGVKVCGCALKMTDRAVLVQASIPCGHPLVDPALLFREPAAVQGVEWDSDHVAEVLEERWNAAAFY